MRYSEPLYTPAEAADRMRLSRGYIYNLVRLGKLRAYRTGQRTIRIPKSAIIAYQVGGIQPIDTAEAQAAAGG